MNERKEGLDRFVGKDDLWVLVNYNIHSKDCYQSWIRVLDYNDFSSNYIVNEVAVKMIDENTQHFLGDNSAKERILYDKKEYNKDNVAMIEPAEVLTTEEIFD